MKIKITGTGYGSTIWNTYKDYQYQKTDNGDDGELSSFKDIEPIHSI